MPDPCWKPEPRAKKSKRGRIPPNRKRKAALFARNFGSEEFVRFTKACPCDICGQAPMKWWYRDDWGNDTAHVKDRGHGGCNSDWTLTIPACPPCHDAGKARGQYAKAREHQKRWRAYQEMGGQLLLEEVEK